MAITRDVLEVLVIQMLDLLRASSLTVLLVAKGNLTCSALSLQLVIKIIYACKLIACCI
jgi:hypothetical protein